MFETICDTVPADTGMPARVGRLDILRRVLDGTLYDNLPYQFHEERMAPENMCRCVCADPRYGMGCAVSLLKTRLRYCSVRHISRPWSVRIPDWRIASRI